MALRVRAGLIVLIIALAGTFSVHADESTSVNLTVGRSTVVDVGAPIARVSLTSADVADALVTSSAQLLVHGKTPGSISMFVWERGGALRRYDVVVQRDLTALSTQLPDLFPGERITAHSNGKSIVLTGTVSNKMVVEKAVEVAAGYVDKKDDVVNLLQVGAAGATQVLLHVRFAEVSRTALTELGATWFTSNNGYKDIVGRVTTEQFPSVDFTDRIGPAPLADPSKEGKMVFSDFLNLFLFSTKYQVATLIKALQTRGLFQSLAEPNVVAESGKEASFLAGGEFPIPIAQGTGAGVAISVQFKEFGIRLGFLPTVTGDRINLKVRPEVSTLDFANAIVLQGFRIPALSTRRVDTEVELQNNQTFAIAGLLNNTATQSLQKIPGIGDIPILGLLFQSKAAQKNQTELVVMITPEILPSNSSGVTSELPRLKEPYLAPLPEKKSFAEPPPAFRPSGRGGASAEPVAPPVAAAPAGKPSDPAAAAAKVSALTKNSPKVATTSNEPPPGVPSKSLSKEERKALEQSQRDERDRAAASPREQAEQQKRDAKLAEEQKKRDAKLAEDEKKKQQAEKEQQEKLARQQLRRDAEEAKKAEEAAKHRAEVEAAQKKKVDEAAARLKEAERSYQAELGKQ